MATKQQRQQQPCVWILNIFVIINVKCSIHFGRFYVCDNGTIWHFFSLVISVTHSVAFIFGANMVYSICHLNKWFSIQICWEKTTRRVSSIKTEGRNIGNGKELLRMMYSEMMSTQGQAHVCARERIPTYFIYFHRIGFLMRGNHMMRNENKTTNDRMNAEKKRKKNQRTKLLYLRSRTWFCQVMRQRKCYAFISLSWRCGNRQCAYVSFHFIYNL